MTRPETLPRSMGGGMRVGIPEAVRRRRHHSARLPLPDGARNNGGDAGRRAREPCGGGGHRAAAPRRFLSIAPRAQTAVGASASTRAKITNFSP